MGRYTGLTPYLLFCSITFLNGAILFGIDTGSFGSLQALPSFLRQFGQVVNGQYTLPPTRKSLMNSLPWIGKIGGCIMSEPIIERVGFKKAMYITAAIQIVGVVLELSAREWVQFSVGRIVAYYAVGLVECITPSYNAEISPASTRGLLAGSMMTLTALGNLWGAGMSRAYVTELSNKGWIIPTAMQFIPAILLITLVPFTQESPRWLILKGRVEEAQRGLDRIRPAAEVDSGATQAEVKTLEQLVKESMEREQGTWWDLFKGNYLRRTWIVSTLFILQQTNGNQFIQSYAPTFYVQQGLGDMSFTYAVIGQAMGVIGCGVGLVLLDIAGRRTLFIAGSCVVVFLLYLASGMGLDSDPNQAKVNTLIACFIIFPIFSRISATNISFLTGAEIGGVRMRKKTMAFGTSIDVLAAFLVTFVTPYLLPNMGVNIGWIFGSVGVICVVWGVLFFPELKWRSLEEVDELFAANLWAWQFAGYKTTGAGSYLSRLEQEHVVEEDTHEGKGSADGEVVTDVQGATVATEPDVQRKI